MRHTKTFGLALVMAAGMVPACNPPAGGSDGDMSSMNQMDGSNNPPPDMTGTDMGSMAACIPSDNNPSCTGAKDCQCEMTKDMLEYCQLWPDMCMSLGSPSTWNICKPGCNECGLDLPAGTCYDPNFICRNTILGKWTFAQGGTTIADYLTGSGNGQIRISIGNISTPSSDWTCSGDYCYQWWKAMATTKHCRIRFSQQCRQADVECWDPGKDPAKGDLPSFTNTGAKCDNC